MTPEAFQTIRSITTSFLNPRSLPLMGCAICTGSAHAGPHTDPPERVLHWNPVKIDAHFFYFFTLFLFSLQMTEFRGFQIKKPC